MSMLSKNLSPIFRCFLATYTTSLGSFSPLALHFILHFAATMEVIHPGGTSCRTANKIPAQVRPLRPYAAPQAPMFPLPAPVKRRKVQLRYSCTVPRQRVLPKYSRANVFRIRAI